MKKLVAIMDGGDWMDASVDHLVIPENMDLEEEKAERDKWYQEVYCPSLQSAEIGKKETIEKYIDFPEWLIMRGARKANEKDITIFWDD